MLPKPPTTVKKKQRRTTRKQSTNRNTLSSIARGMQHAVNATQEIMEYHYARLFGRYFKKDGSPKMATFNISPGKMVQAPLIALVPLSALVLDEMEVNMSIQILGAKPKWVEKSADVEQSIYKAKKYAQDVDRSSFEVSFAPGDRPAGAANSESEQRDNTIGIVMKFKRGDPPEGVARVVDEFYKAVVVGSTEEEEK